MKNLAIGYREDMAERVGFEPTVLVRAQRFARFKLLVLDSVAASRNVRFHLACQQSSCNLMPVCFTLL